MSIDKKSKKASTSITLSLRLDPRSKYLIDLLARHQKRTITGVIEWAVERAGAEAIFDNDRGTSFLDVIDLLWSTDESVRLANLAIARPDLLTYDELRIWETIKASPALWNTSGQLSHSTLQKEWGNLLEYVEQHRLNRAVKPYLV
ncbi:hypothetical protein [Aeromonas veronii]|uniref:hypothetical protein n=1 Tax=Aeromonas veronii TaxID=654 RepID=UPI000E17EE8C|nr:hypothetical protein [Aeromonas veronii]RDE61033.1 hypothetical protein DV708_17180 [Aeromonas veronii]